MSFLNPVPELMRVPQPPDPGDLLMRDGRNVASAFERLGRQSADARQRVEEYLSRVVPGTRGAKVVRALGMETLAFLQDVAGQKDPWQFNALSMSDGTLRAFAALVALFRPNGSPQSLLALEEPEIALHPAAAGILLDALEEASINRQILVTTHSPDLLDNPKIDTDRIRAVVLDKGQTQIGPLDKPGRTALQEHLYTAGELLRLAQLAPDPETSGARQLALFEAE
jgi:predicted ATPase